MDDIQGYFSLIEEHYSKLLAKEIIVAYDGDVTHQVMKAITSMVEEKLENEKEKEPVRRKLYHIMVECLQNVNRHAEAFYGDGKDHYPGRGALLVSQSEKYYIVFTANVIRTSHVNDLETFLKKINPLSGDKLNDLYKDKLMEGSLSSKGGAGLGFIDIRRKTSNEMEFSFVKKDEEISFFLFSVKITR